MKHDRPEAGAAAGCGAKADAAEWNTTIPRPGRSGRLSGCEQAVRALERWAYWHKHMRGKPKIPRVDGPLHGTTHDHE